MMFEKELQGLNERSFTGFGIFEFFEFLLVSLFLGDGGFEGSMLVIRLIDGDQWSVDGIVHDKGAGEDEDLPHP